MITCHWFKKETCAVISVMALLHSAYHFPLLNYDDIIISVIKLLI